METAVKGGNPMNRKTIRISEKRQLTIPPVSYTHLLEDYDMIAGNFFICGIEGDAFVSLSDPLMIKYQEKFRYPELIGNSPMGLFSQKCSEQTYQRIQEELKHPPKRPKDKSAPER